MEFDRELSEELCEQYFQKMFGNIWTEAALELIIFPGGFENSSAYKNFAKHNSELEEKGKQETKLYFLANFFGDSLWDVFSNNHTVFSVEDRTEFSIGSWRGSGSFIAAFIQHQNKELIFDYMDFYMGHFENEPEAKSSYEFIFTQLKTNDFDWQYAYPQLGIVDFSANKKEDISTYNPNKALEDESEKNNLLKLINDINAERKEEIQASQTPAVIIAYANVFGRYPAGWEDC